MSNWDQYIHNFAGMADTPLEQLLRLLFAAMAGGLVGLERELRGRQAGWRTNILVSVGSALVMVVSAAMVGKDWPHAGTFNVNVDPGRIAYGVMAGIGFLGAGTIIKQGGSIRGLTTAAALWCVAALGLAAGLGLYTLTILATILIVLVLWFLDYLEERLPRRRYRPIVLRRPWESDCIQATMDHLKSTDLGVSRIAFHRTPDLASVEITLHISYLSTERFGEIVAKIIREAKGWDLVAMREEET